MENVVKQTTNVLSNNVPLQPTGSTASQDNDIQCPICPQPRFFKGQRGLRIHASKTHKQNSEQPISQFLNYSNNQNKPFYETLSQLKHSVPLVKRIPRAARSSVAKKLSESLKTAVSDNSKHSWELLLTFPYRILHADIDRKNLSLTSSLKSNCCSSELESDRISNLLKHPTFRNGSSIYKKVERKVHDGDVKSAARLLFSNDAVAPNIPSTLAALHSKHPPLPSNLNLPDAPENTDIYIVASTQDVLHAVKSFNSGSAGGLDGLTPQHLKDLLYGTPGDAGTSLLEDLTALVNLMLSGKINESITEILYGANLCALAKKDGGVRPIAIGTTYRRLAAKICCKAISHNLKKEFEPYQLGFGSKGGCEAAIHSLRTYITKSTNDILLKVDVKNAFNSLSRDALLTQIKQKIPHIYNFLWQCYSEPTKLMYLNNTLLSAVGCQQGDPLGPAIFSLGINPIIRLLNSKFNVWYLDDGTLGGSVNTVFDDLHILIQEFEHIGLELNFSKCELFIPDSLSNKDEVISKFNTLAPNIKILNESSLHLLGSPIFDESFPSFVENKISKFCSNSDRLLNINTHIAYNIIRYCLFVPNFTQVLRSTPFWKYPDLTAKFDEKIKCILSSLFNITFEDRIWTQASLPVRHGGLGIRQISHISLPAFLSSAHGTQNLVKKILTPFFGDFEIAYLPEAKKAWSLACPNVASPINPKIQRQWDEPINDLYRTSLLDSSQNSAESARLLAVSKWESGLWLHTIPSPHIGTLLDNATFRLSISLRLGAKTNAPHYCRCGDNVSALGHHGLSCLKSAGRLLRHSAINDILRRALVTAGVPAILEPPGLIRDDGKRPDGMSLVPWRMGRPLVWDFTCVDTVAPSHLQNTSKRAGAAATHQESIKRRLHAEETNRRNELAISSIILIQNNEVLRHTRVDLEGVSRTNAYSGKNGEPEV
ncbi:uncharacterized protein LOC128202180 [Galleria mellonella]|uniref:Uncharacterized protein LOC128202180 n=1 Tax=Galleria mellonella TaxID=7137 RepID=A0ABM3N1K8_GALME|nr:uncharacterized protein LOC128202180 [Galleria mellonella]